MRFPFEGLRSDSLPRRCRHRRGHLSWSWLRCRVLCANRYRTPWVIRSRRDVVDLRLVFAVFPGSPSPESLRVRVHPLVRFASPSESLEPNPPRLPSIVLADPRRCRAPPLGFPSPSRRQQSASTRASVPSSLSSVLDVSHVLDGLLRSLPCGFVSPRCHVRDSLFRGFPFHAAVRARHSPIPSWRWRPPPVIGCPITPGAFARLQGLSPRGSPTATRGCLAHDPPAPLLSFPFLGFCFAHQEDSGLSASVPHRPRPCLRWSSTCCRCST